MTPQCEKVGTLLDHFLEFIDVPFVHIRGEDESTVPADVVIDE